MIPRKIVNEISPNVSYLKRDKRKRKIVKKVLLIKTYRNWTYLIFYGT